jgi:hypothetical protein
MLDNGARLASSRTGLELKWAVSMIVCGGATRKAQSILFQKMKTFDRLSPRPGIEAQWPSCVRQPGCSVPRGLCQRLKGLWRLIGPLWTRAWTHGTHQL